MGSKQLVMLAGLVSVAGSIAVPVAFSRPGVSHLTRHRARSCRRTAPIRIRERYSLQRRCELGARGVPPQRSSTEHELPSTARDLRGPELCRIAVRDGSDRDGDDKRRRQRQRGCQLPGRPGERPTFAGRNRLAVHRERFFRIRNRLRTGERRLTGFGGRIEARTRHDAPLRRLRHNRGAHRRHHLCRLQQSERMDQRFESARRLRSAALRFPSGRGAY